MKKLLVVLALLFAAATLPVFAAEATTNAPVIAKEKIAEIEKALRLIGTEKLMSQMKTQLFGIMRQQMKDAPEEFWKTTEEKFDTSELMKFLIPLYDKYYTIEDLKAMNAFYESPAGQKVLATLPAITQESMKIGQAWGEQVARRVQQEIQEQMRQKKERPAKPI
jgi:hypothetical protein